MGLPTHLEDHDILPGLREIQSWENGFSATGFQRELCMSLLSRGLDKIDDPEICAEMVRLWTTNTKNFREFFRTGDRDDSGFTAINEVSRRKWIAAIIYSSDSDPNDQIDSLLWDTYRLINPQDFGWVLETFRGAEKHTAPTWAKVVEHLLWDEKIRVSWWDEFIDTYQHSDILQAQMSWFEEIEIDTPNRRSAKARWLWRERRHERLLKRFQKRKNRPDPKTKIENAISKISNGESWAFKNLCWSLALNEEGYCDGHLRHNISDYPGWTTITVDQREFIREAARQFLLERSDGWKELGARTDYSDPGVVAIWMLFDEIETDTSLRDAVADKWIDAIVGVDDSSSEHSKILFGLAYRINPSKTIDSWIREIRRDSESFGHLFAIRRAGSSFDHILAQELFNLLKILKDPESVKSAIYELEEFDRVLAGELAVYLLQRETRRSKPYGEMATALIIAGLGTGAHQVWPLTFPILKSHPSLAKRALLSVAKDVDSLGDHICREFTADELADFYILLCQLFPLSQDPADISGYVSPRQSLTHLRSGILETLSNLNTQEACAELKRLSSTFPDQESWLQRRYQQTLSRLRRNEWTPIPISDL